MSNIDKQALRGQSVDANFYLAECCNCGQVMPSSKLIESRNYPDGDADCYCPHCNADDCDINDMGSAASEAWNYQQKRIEALLDELEAKEEQRANWFQMAEKLGADLDAAERRIAELEAREVKLPDINNYLSDVTEPTLDRALRLTAKGVRSGDIAAIRAAGITVKVDSE